MQQRAHAFQTHDANGPTVPRAIRDGATNAGGITFVSASGSEKHYSFAELATQVERRGLELLAAGLRKGDRVGFVLPDNLEFVFSFLGAMSVGVVPVPMYPPLSLGRLDGYIDTASRILGAAEARALLTERRAQTVLWSLVSKVESLEQLLVVEELPHPTADARVDVDAVALDDVAFIQFTSGSTSDPKGVVVNHRSLLANLNAIMTHGLEVAPGDMAVSWLPMYHDMGLIGFILAPLWYGVPTVYIPTLDFVKHPTLWMETLHKYRGNMTFAPNFAFALATRRTSEKKLAKLDLSHVKVVGCGAEPNNPATLNAFCEHFAKAGLKPGALLPCYGMAEATLAMTFNPLHRGLRTDVVDSNVYHAEGRALQVKRNGNPILEFVSCGVPLPTHGVRIIDPDGNELPERHVGEVVFYGPSVTSGYFHQEDATAAAFHDDGLHTGDLGYVAEGELYVTGRKKDIIILNGRNYDPQSIEWETAEVTGIRKGNVVAFSRPSTSTEELIVVAEAKPDHEEAELTAAVRTRIAEKLHLNVSDVMLLAPGQLPKTSSGKLQRQRTRQQYLEGTLGIEGIRTLGSRGQAFTVAKHISLSLMARLRHKLKRLPRAMRRRLRSRQRA